MSTSVSSSRQRILSLWLRRLSADRLQRQWHEHNSVIPEAAKRLSGIHSGSIPPPTVKTMDSGFAPTARPGMTGVVVYAKRGNVEVLVAVDAAAERLGVKPGLALAEARAMHPALIAVPEDAAADARLLETIADWCQRYTPLIAADGADGLLLDIGGCAHLFGGEASLRDDLVKRLTHFGLAVSAAIADTTGAAWALARFSHGTLIDSGAEAEALAPLPLAALRIPAETVTVMRRLGLRRICDIIAIPRAPLTARFGSLLLRQLDRALGKEREPLTPRLPVAPYFTEQPFAEPIAREDDVLMTIHRLASRLQPMLEARREGATRVELCLFRTDGAVFRLAVGMSRPVRDPSEIRALFVERLAALADPLDPGFGFDLARLSVVVSASAPNEQAGLEKGEDGADFGRLVDRLSARFGSRRIGRLIVQNSHIPELAAFTVMAQAHVAGVENGWAAFRRFRDAVDLSPRPLRLLARPERIEVTPMMVDMPPLRFQWRRAWHDVQAADGPERIEAAWWTEEDGPARDYFRVEDRAGLRFWLFRAGLYRDEGAPIWFMHGLFA